MNTDLKSYCEANLQEEQYRAISAQTIYLDVGKRVKIIIEQASDDHLGGLSLLRQEKMCEMGILAKKQDSQEFAHSAAAHLSEELSKRNLKDLAQALAEAAEGSCHTIQP